MLVALATIIPMVLMVPAGVVVIVVALAWLGDDAP
jgi:hypothetical protein